MAWQRYKLNLRNSLHYKHVDTKKEVNSNIHLLLSHCSPPSQGHYFLIPIFPQSFRSAVAYHGSFDHEFFLNTNLTRFAEGPLTNGK